MEGTKRCAACGAALGGGQFCEKCGADQAAISFEQDKARMLFSGPLRSARKSLLWVAGLTTLAGLLLFAGSSGDDVAGLMSSLVFAAVYVGLWQWAKQQPLGATAAGLGIYVTLQLGMAAIDPSTILQGVLVKIAIIVVLVRGVRAAVMLRSHGVRAF
jgi:hypothetical protein